MFKVESLHRGKWAPNPGNKRPGTIFYDSVLCRLYPYPCPKKFYKLPAVLFCYTNLLYKLAWAWAWV